MTTLSSRCATGLLLLAVSGCGAEEARKRAMQAEERAAAAAAAAKQAATKTGDTTKTGEAVKVEYAQSLWIGPPKAGDMFTASDVEVMESMPVQFAISIAQKAGVVKFDLDELGEPNADNVRVAKLTFKEPNTGGKDEAKLRLALGSMKVGKYELQLHVKFKGSETHALEQTLELTAK